MSTLDKSAIADALQEFVNTGNPQAAIEAFRRHSTALLSEEALKLLDSNLERSPDDKEARAIFGLRRQAMVAARAHGVEAGVAQLYLPNPRVEQLVLAFVNADYVGKVQQLRQNPALTAPESVECLEMLAWRHAGRPDEQNVINLARALIDVARQSDVDTARQWLRGQVIDAIQRGESAAAPQLVSAWETALELSKGDGEPVTRAQIEVNLGQAYRSRDEPGDLDRAVTTLEHALEVMTREAYPQHFSGIHRALGNIFFNDMRLSVEARCKRAIEHYSLARESLLADDDPQNALHINFMLGSCWQILNDPERARACLLNGLVFVDRADLGQAIAACDSIATVMNGGGAETEAALHDALSKLSARVDSLPADTYPDERASRHHEIANVFRESFGPWRSSDIERAIAHTDAAARIWTRQVNPDMWARMQHNLGTAYGKRVKQEKADNIEQAIHYYENALMVHTREAYPAFWALTNNALGIAWLERPKGNQEDNAEAAVKFLTQAITVWNAGTDAFHQGECYNGLGAAHLRLISRYGRKALDNAIDCFKRAATLHTRERFPTRWVQVQNNLANAYLRRDGPGDAVRAINLLQQASAATDRSAESYLWATFKKNEGAAHSQVTGEDKASHEDAAIAAFQDALPVFVADQYLAEHRDTQAALGQMWFRRSDWSAALAAYRNAIDAAEHAFAQAYTETGRLTEAEELSAIYRNAAFCLVQLGNAHDALELYDRGKTRVLTDAIALSQARFDRLPSSQREEAIRARDTIAAAESQMRQPESTPGRPSNSALGQAIAQARERLSMALGQGSLTRTALAELLRAIPVGGALVVPMLTSRGGVAFVVPHHTTAVSSEHVVPVSIDFDGANDWLVGTEDKPGLLRTYVAFLNERAHGSPEAQDRAFNRYLLAIETACQLLWPALMQPIAERLETLGLQQRAPVLMIPHGALALLPLHAASPKPRQCFLQQFDVQYSPSLAIRTQTLDRVDSSGRPLKLLAIADPGGDLEFADIECVELARSFGIDGAVVLRGAAATHDAVLAAAEASTHLHFACHGFYDWRDPLRSGLILAGSRVLDVAEIMSPQFDLDAARVVVLSACETGLFDYNRYPDEFVGLNSGLLMAGTPAVVSTLWAVEERSTALLMSEFYVRLLAGESISSAICQAQRWLSGLTFSELKKWVVDRQSIYRVEAGRNPRLELVAKAIDEWVAQLATMEAVDPERRPFEPPYYWAAFTASGAV